MKRKAELSSDVRSSPVLVYLFEDERDALRDYCKALHVSMSTFLRITAMRAIGEIDE